MAFITYDHGFGAELDAVPFRNYARYEIALKDPDDRGMPQGAEFAALDEVEDRLSKGLGESKGLGVGRITVDGRRYVIFYTSLDEAVAVSVGRAVGADSGYDISLSFRFDPDRTGYWEELFPTEDDWQVIRDMRLEDQLRGEGDPLTEPRPITHWAYFPETSGRAGFVDAVTGTFDDIELYETPESETGVHTVMLTHTGLPDYRSMQAFTLLLNREANRFGGDYDGWETEVRRQ